MRASRSHRWRGAVLGVGILMLLVPLQQGIHRARPEVFDPNRKTRRVSVMELGPTPAVVASLGGFRTVAADLLWLRMERTWDTGNWWALLPLLEAVTQLDPHFVLAWKVYGWHAAYNLNAASETVVDKGYWLERGLQILERGVEANPESWEAVFELGWTYYDRAHQPYRAEEYFKRADALPGAPHYVTRMTYRVYESIMDFDRLFPAMEAAAKKHLDSKPHQKLVHRDIDWWTEHWNDPQEHRRQIVHENTARLQRALPFYTYPNDPFWEVCAVDGLPSPKGSERCEHCGRPFPPAGTTEGGR